MECTPLHWDTLCSELCFWKGIIMCTCWFILVYVLAAYGRILWRMVVYVSAHNVGRSAGLGGSGGQSVGQVRAVRALVVTDTEVLIPLVLVHTNVRRQK